MGWFVWFVIFSTKEDNWKFIVYFVGLHSYFGLIQFSIGSDDYNLILVTYVQEIKINYVYDRKLKLVKRLNS